MEGLHQQYLRITST